MEEESVCKNCGNQREDYYPFSLCKDCRDTLARRPLPAWIKIASVVVILILCYAFTKFPPSLRAGIVYERGREAEAHGNFSSAADEYAKVLEQFSDSTLVLARLGVSQYRAGRLEDAASTFHRIAGRKTSKELVAEVNAVIKEMSHTSDQSER